MRETQDTVDRECTTGAVLLRREVPKESCGICAGAQPLPQAPHEQLGATQTFASDFHDYLIPCTCLTYLTSLAMQLESFPNPSPRQQATKGRLNAS